MPPRATPEQRQWFSGVVALARERASTWAEINAAYASAKARSGRESLGQGSLFDAGELPSIPEEPDRETFSAADVEAVEAMIADEIDAVGLPLTASPLAVFECLLRFAGASGVGLVAVSPVGSEVCVAGVVAAVEEKTLRSRRAGEPSLWATFRLEGSQASCNALCWPEAYEKHGRHIKVGRLVVARGAVATRRKAKEGDGAIDEQERVLHAREVAPAHTEKDREAVARYFSL